MERSLFGSEGPSDGGLMVGLWWVESIQPTMLNPFGAKAFPYVGLGLDHFSAKTKNFPVGLAEFLVGLRKITGRPKRNYW